MVDGCFEPESDRMRSDKCDLWAVNLHLQRLDGAIGGVQCDRSICQKKQKKKNNNKNKKMENQICKSIALAFRWLSCCNRLWFSFRFLILFQFAWPYRHLIPWEGTPEAEQKEPKICSTPESNRCYIKILAPLSLQRSHARTNVISNLL